MQLSIILIRRIIDNEMMVKSANKNKHCINILKIILWYFDSFTYNTKCVFWLSKFLRFFQLILTQYAKFSTCSFKFFLHLSVFMTIWFTSKKVKKEQHFALKRSDWWKAFHSNTFFIITILKKLCVIIF